MIVTCLCGQKNRVKRLHKDGSARCGKCHLALPVEGWSWWPLSAFGFLFRPLRRVPIWAIALLMAATTISFTLLIVWPTPWRYDELRLGSIDVVIRTNRLSGEVQRLDPINGDWITTSRPAPAASR